MTHWYDGLTKGSDWKEKIFTPLAYVGVVGLFAFLFYWSATH